MSTKPPGYRFGRPTKYRKEFCEKLIDHMASGLSFESFGGEIFCTSEVLYDWLRMFPDFLQAKKTGEILCRNYWEKLGRDEIISNGGKSLNSPIWIFNMKNRFMWTDRQEVVSTQETTINDKRKFKLVEPTE
jgi:hypothetical protein